MHSFSLSPFLSNILSPQAIRKASQTIYDSALKGETHFKVYENKISEATQYVLDVIETQYPDWNIPYHSRWGHFRAAGKQRWAYTESLFNELSPFKKLVTQLDLVIVSVFLDAGAGMKWSFYDSKSGQTLSKSEGLALASLNAFESGRFSKYGLRVDADALIKMKAVDILEDFQVTAENPLVGVEGRALLLNQLGHSLKKFPEYFYNPDEDSYRPGNIAIWLSKQNPVLSTEALLALLIGFSEMWPKRLEKDGLSLGDVWEYKGQLVPFHKLSQWLLYSMIEPLEAAGLQFVGVEKLTGLPEYRNGGLFFDLGVIELRDSSLLNQEHEPASELVIEWRALTIILLDKVHQEICRLKNKDIALAKVLEGGTWAAGRKIAKAKRADGGPPLRIKSDATVF